MTSHRQQTPYPHPATYNYAHVDHDDQTVRSAQFPHRAAAFRFVREGLARIGLLQKFHDPQTKDRSELLLKTGFSLCQRLRIVRIKFVNEKKQIVHKDYTEATKVVSITGRSVSPELQVLVRVWKSDQADVVPPHDYFWMKERTGRGGNKFQAQGRVKTAHELRDLISKCGHDLPEVHGLLASRTAQFETNPATFLSLHRHASLAPSSINSGRVEVHGPQASQAAQQYLFPALTTCVEVEWMAQMPGFWQLATPDGDNLSACRTRIRSWWAEILNSGRIDVDNTRVDGLKNALLTIDKHLRYDAVMRLFQALALIKHDLVMWLGSPAPNRDRDIRVHDLVNHVLQLFYLPPEAAAKISTAGLYVYAHQLPDRVRTAITLLHQARNGSNAVLDIADNATQGLVANVKAVRLPGSEMPVPVFFADQLTNPSSTPGGP
ncbi:hypothetical protein OIO90_004478 [Microbotryomycetes sp. JL221]|nr:hypothetical protein OIO90_004478 [Microbotryomycetes sp. JL221]